MWIIKIIKIKCFYPPRILDEHWCIYSCLQIPPRENWFQYVRRVYETAINFPYITTLHRSVSCLCIPPPWNRMIYARDKRVTEIDQNLWNAIFSTGSQHVLLCTSTVHDQSANICIQGYLRILWIRNTKSSKIDKIHKCYVLCLKLEYFFKSCKT